MKYHDCHDQASDPKYAYLWHSEVKDYLKGQRRRKGRPKGASQSKVEAAMHEVFTNEPSTVTRANVSGERKRKMKIAIAFAKARKS
jgi:hypothetical protein